MNRNLRSCRRYTLLVLSERFNDLLELAAKRAPARQLVSIEDVSVATAILATDYTKLITGETVYVDAGYHRRVIPRA